MQKPPTFPERFWVSKEFQLLAACSWVAPESLEQARTEKIAALCYGGVDWDKFISLVRRHGVPALAYSSVSRLSDIKIPQNIREALQKNASQGRHRALFQAAELVRLTKLFTRQGIALLPLKGVFLSHHLYGDMGLRCSGDLDFIVKPEHFDMAEQILEAEGYICYFYGFELTARRKKYVRNSIHHYEFEHIKTGLHVELHWNLGSWLPERLSEFWSHTRQQEWHGAVFTSLDDDALLLQLCDHGTRHEWVCLKWLSDVARLLVTGRTTSWESLFALASRLDLLRVLAHSALMAHWIYGVPLPAEFINLIQKEKLAIIMSEKAVRKMLMDDSTLSSIGTFIDFWQMKQLRPSVSYGQQLRSLFITHADWRVLPLPDYLFWLYYPLRPVLCIWRKLMKKW